MPKWCTFTSVFLVHFSLVGNTGLRFVFAVLHYA
jgi:hypothetical protein